MKNDITKLIERANAVSTYSTAVDQGHMLNALVGMLTGLLYEVDDKGMISAERVVKMIEGSEKAASKKAVNA